MLNIKKNTAKEVLQVSTSGIVYILTNPCLDGWVKIDITKKSGVTA